MDAWLPPHLWLPWMWIPVGVILVAAIVEGVLDWLEGGKHE